MPSSRAAMLTPSPRMSSPSISISPRWMSIIPQCDRPAGAFSRGSARSPQTAAPGLI
jgi:hypothetical protein